MKRKNRGGMKGWKLLILDVECSCVFLFFLFLGTLVFFLGG